LTDLFVLFPSPSNEARNQKDAGFSLIAACFMLVSCLAYSSALKMETTRSTEMQAYFQRTT
jgi:hypothetical protein